MTGRESEEWDSRVGELMSRAERILFITGAGFSVDSGLPTYRGIGGLYEARDTPHGMPIEEALSGAMFRERPDVTWRYLWEIAARCRGAKPNRGHAILAEIEREKPDTWVLTQNVDGLHVAAGSRNVIEIHGRASDLYCIGCGERYEGEKRLFGGYAMAPKPPECPSCGAILRPDVVLFGELLPETEVAKLEGLIDLGIELVVSAGTSSLFPYIVAPMKMARDAGVPTVEINTSETEASRYADYRIEESCADAMERIRSVMQ